jgi:hypothetical protein
MFRLRIQDQQFRTSRLRGRRMFAMISFDDNAVHSLLEAEGGGKGADAA